MFQRKIYLDAESWIEISTRLFNKEEVVMVSISGKKNDKEKTVSSALIRKEQAVILLDALKGAIDHKSDFPTEESL